MEKIILMSEQPNIFSKLTKDTGESLSLKVFYNKLEKHLLGEPAWAGKRSRCSREAYSSSVISRIV